MVEEVDLTDVDPVRRAETLRRVKVVLRYLALARPTKQDAVEHAAELGIGRNQFLTLVRAWAEHRRASALPGAQRRYHFLREESRNRVDPRIDEAIQRGIAEAGADQPINRIRRHIEELCAEAGLHAPTLPAIRSRVEASRRAIVNSPAVDPLVLVGRAALDLPVAAGDGLVQPAVLALAVSARFGHVLAFHAGTASRPGSIAKVIGQLASIASDEAMPVELHIALARGNERRALQEALKISGLADNVVWVGQDLPLRTVQGALGGLLGRWRLTVPSSRAAWKPMPRLKAGLAQAVPQEQLDEVTADMVALHNAAETRSASGPPPVSFGDDLSRLILTRALDNLLD